MQNPLRQWKGRKNDLIVGFIESWNKNDRTRIIEVQETKHCMKLGMFLELLINASVATEIIAAVDSRKAANLTR